MSIIGKLWNRIKSKLSPADNRSPAGNRCFRYLVVVVFCFIALLMTLLVPIGDKIDALKYAPTAVLASAFLAVMFTYIAKLVTGILETDRYEIPEILLDRINDEITVRIGYYKTDTSIHIGPIKDGKLKFVLDSSIVGMRNGVRISRPVEVGEPICPKDVEVNVELHQIAGYMLHEGEVALIDKGSFESEHIEISYDTKDKHIPKLKDDHTWSAPSSGKVAVCFDLPGYECKAYTIVGNDEESIKSLVSMDRSRTRFLHSDPMFTNQRIVWSIEKKQEEA